MRSCDDDQAKWKERGKNDALSHWALQCVGARIGIGAVTTGVWVGAYIDSVRSNLQGKPKRLGLQGWQGWGALCQAGRAAQADRAAQAGRGGKANKADKQTKPYGWTKSTKM